MVAFRSGPRPKGMTIRKAVKNLKKIMDRDAAREAAMEAEKVKVQDEKDMSNVQGAKGAPTAANFKRAAQTARKR